MQNNLSPKDEVLAIQRQTARIHAIAEEMRASDYDPSEDEPDEEDAETVRRRQLDRWARVVQMAERSNLGRFV